MTKLDFMVGADIWDLHIYKTIRDKKKRLFVRIWPFLLSSFVLFSVFAAFIKLKLLAKMGYVLFKEMTATY